jgi:hypothetical protein
LPRSRLPPFKALHLLYPLVCGLDQIHGLGEYHGDLHAKNILVQPSGIVFAVKLLDVFRYATLSAVVEDNIALFRETMGERAVP